jgi:hypothetical protein
MSTNLVDYFLYSILCLDWFTGACGFVGLVWFVGWDYQAYFSLSIPPKYPKKTNTIILTILKQKSLSNVAY